jgi:hypothetical protein
MVLELMGRGLSFTALMLLEISVLILEGCGGVLVCVFACLLQPASGLASYTHSICEEKAIYKCHNVMTRTIYVVYRSLE